MVKKLFGYSMATWLGALISFVLMPVASHLYSSHELGAINYYYSIINIIFTIVLLGLDQAYLRFFFEYNEIERKRQFTRNIIFTVGLVFVLCALCFPFSNKISKWLIDTEASIICVIILLHLSGLIISRYFVILFRIRSKIISYTIFSVVNTILLKSMYLFGYPIKPDAITGVWITSIISIIIGLLLLAFNRNSLMMSKLVEKDQITINEFKYAIPLVPAMVFAILNNSIPQIILRSKTDFSNVAVYSIGVTLASTITLLHNGLNTFLEPYIFSNYESKKEQIAKIMDLFTVIAYIICMFIVLFQNIFFLVFKRDYIISTQFLPFLLCSSLWYTLGDFYNVGVKISKRTKENISAYFIGFVTNALLSIIIIPIFGCLGAAVSAATASAIMAILKIRKGQKHYRIISNYKNIVLGALIIIVISVSNYVLWDSSVKYGVTIAGIVLYVFVSGILKDIIALFKKRNGISK